MAKREPLSRQRVLEAALGLADREGIDALSMRRLGQALGVEAMSLYNHVQNKDDLLDGLVGLVFAEIDFPGEATSWRASLRQRAISQRQVLHRHPWAIGLMESRTQAGPASLRHHDAVLGTLRNAGFSLEATGHAYAILDSYIYGFTLNERSLPTSTPDDFTELGKAFRQELPENQFPHLFEFLTGWVLKDGYSYAAEFEFGLDLILDGLERLRASA